MTLDEMRGFFEMAGEKRFRADQVFGWISKGAVSFDEMTNLPLGMREKLSERCRISDPEKILVQRSKTDGTRKYLFGMEGGSRIESVFMKYSYGNSICISSQAGCRMGCAFCASTRNGLERNLTAGEMVSQLLAASADTGERIGHVVVMGTGEPFENYEELSRFIRILNEKKGLGIGMRNITVSTCGIIPVIDRFAADFREAGLAISLHAADDRLRSKLMPVNRKYPLADLMKAAEGYIEKTGRRLTFEYALIDGVNDSSRDIKKLAGLLCGMNAHVNLIPLNEVSETGFCGSGRKKAEQIRDMLESRGIRATVRRELGSDIDAACGQLRLSKV